MKSERLDRTAAWRPGEGLFVWCDGCSAGMVLPDGVVSIDCEEHGRMVILDLVPSRVAEAEEEKTAAERTGREAWRRVATVLKNTMLDLLDHQDPMVVAAADAALREAWMVARDKPIDVIRKTEVPPAPGEPS